MTIKFRHPVELELSEEHLVLLEAMARKTRSSVSDIAQELLEDYLNHINKEEELWAA